MTDTRTEVDTMKTSDKQDGKSGMNMNTMRTSDLLQVKMKVDGLD